MENETRGLTEDTGVPTQNNDSASGELPEDFNDETEVQSEAADDADQSGLSFKELFEQSLEGIQEGAVTRGEIIAIDNDYVLVDIGYKSEGQIRISEFMDGQGNLKAKVGDMVDVLLVRREDSNGRIILSRERAAEVKFWDQVKDIYNNKETIKGRIISRIKGGFAVDIGLQAFLPGSQVDRHPVKDPDSIIGSETEFRIIKFDKRRNNIVLSRRAVIEGERKALREKTLECLEKDAILEGTVTNLTHYGLFVDLGGIDGLVHVTDMSWGRVGEPSEKYSVGDQIKVKVLNYDKEKGRVSLGIKQLTPDPWQEAGGKYPVGTKIKGRVSSFAKFGAFVETEEGLSGLIHLDELSWTKKVKHPSQILNVGDEVEAVVLDIDVDKQRISLSKKQLEPNPWEVIATKFPIGAIIQGKIRNITDFGIFVGIDEGIDGLVHVSDLSWTKTIKHPSELYQKGQEVQAVILDIDSERERFSLGIKQLSPDPWDEIPTKYRAGTMVKGKITNVTDFGLFVEVEEGIEGLVHVSELPKKEGGSPMEGFTVGDEVEALVVHVSREDKKIGLSIRRSKDKTERRQFQTYLNNPMEATSNLGELLKREMLNQTHQNDHEGGDSDSD
ncbi:MAG: 30S ribosomal protein S1 [Desulfatiglandales bacterium]